MYYEHPYKCLINNEEYKKMPPQNSDADLNRQENTAMIYIRSRIRGAYIICKADIIPTGISPVTAGNGYH